MAALCFTRSSMSFDVQSFRRIGFVESVHAGEALHGSTSLSVIESTRSKAPSRHAIW